MYTKVFTLILLLLAALNIHSQSGAIDVTFNPGDLGFGKGDGATPNDVMAISVTPDGKILIGGQFFNYNGTSRHRIAKLNADGSLDAGFDPGTGVSNTVNAMRIQPDGKILIAGSFTEYNGTLRNRIARLNADGSLDAGFDPGTGADNTVYSLNVQPDGKIIIGGGFTSYNGTSRNSIARLNADGSLDAGFDPGTGVDSAVYSLNLQPDGKILIGGDFTSYNGAGRNRVARLNDDGSLDAGFDPGTGANNTVLATGIQPDGKILIGGNLTNYNGTGRGRIARLNADGSLDAGFNTGIGSHWTVFTINIQPDGKILIGGLFASYNGTSRNRIARLNADGSLDADFDPGTGCDGGVRAIDIQPDGKILIGGHFTSFNDTGPQRITRLNVDGSLDTGFNPCTGANSWVTAMNIQPDGKILVGGQFTSYDGASRLRIARLYADGSLDAGFDPGKGAKGGGLFAIGIQPDGKILIGGQFTSYNGTLRGRIARLNADGSMDAGFEQGTGATGGVFAIEIQPDGKILIAGGFSSYNGTIRLRIARLNTDGSLDASFDPVEGTDSWVFVMGVQPDGKILIGGDFMSYNGTSRNRIARLNADGSLDAGFDPGTGPDKMIDALEILPDGKILISGFFTSYNGTSRNRIARLNADGSLDAGFDPGMGTFDPGSWINDRILAMDVQPDGKILIGGDFISYNGTSRNRIARLNADGSLDAGFDPGTGANNGVRAIRILSDGNILIAGGFTGYDGTGKNRVARVNGMIINSVAEPDASRQVQLLQNRPNPFERETVIGFILPEACEAQLRVYDVNGRELLLIKKIYAAGYHEETLSVGAVSGLLICELATPFGVRSRKMLVAGN